MAIEKYLDLPDEIYDKFDALSDEAYEDFVNKKYQSSFEKYERCLAMIPEPKKDYGDASNVIEWMVENYLKIGDYPNAIKWVEDLGNYLKNIDILGDWEFLKGKVYYEAGDPEKALENFRVAHDKTKGSCFEEQDKKYITFFKNPAKYTGSK